MLISSKSNNKFTYLKFNYFDCSKLEWLSYGKDTGLWLEWFMDRFSKVRKMKYTYTHIHTHGSWSYFVADILKMLFSVKNLKENIFFTSLEGENRISFYSEAQKHSLHLQVSFSFQLLDYRYLRILLSSPRNILTKKTRMPVINQTLIQTFISHSWS